MSTWSEKNKAWSARRQQVVALRANGLSYREIGDRMKPRISGARVKQILDKEAEKAAK